MWQMSVPWWEFAGRGIVVYPVPAGVHAALTGKQQTGSTNRLI